MWHEDNVCAEQRGRPYILNDIVVVTYQDTAFPSVQFKDRERISRGDMRIDEGMKLAVTRNQSIGAYRDISLVDISCCILFKKTSANYRA